MAYNIPDKRLLELCITDPSYCLFYHRARLKDLLPEIAKSHLLVTTISEMVDKGVEESKKEEIAALKLKASIEEEMLRPNG